MTEKPDFSKYGGLILIGGAVFWGVSEVMQLFSGELAEDAMVIGTVAFADLGIGIWGVWFAFREKAGLFGLLGTAILSVGFLLLGVLRILTAVEQGLQTPTWFPDATLFGVGAVIALLGAILFSGTIIRTSSLPRWTGVVLIIGMLITLMSAAAEIPRAIPHLANLAMVVTFLLVGVIVLQKPMTQFQSASVDEGHFGD